MFSYRVEHRAADYYLQPAWVAAGYADLERAWCLAESLWGLARSIYVYPSEGEPGDA